MEQVQQPSKCQSLVKLINIGIQPLYLYIIYTVNSSSFPFVAEKKSVGTEITGLIFASWSFPAFIIPFVLPNLFACVGKKRMFIASLVVIIVSIGATGVLTLFNTIPFTVIAFTLRVVQGICAAILFPMYFTLGAQLYPKTKDTVYAWQVMTSVVGLGIGPFIGAPLYKALGFDFIQYFTALIGLFIFLPLAVFGIPVKIDQNEEKKQPAKNEFLDEDAPLLGQIDESSCDLFYSDQISSNFQNNTASTSMSRSESNTCILSGKEKKFSSSCQDLYQQFNQSNACLVIYQEQQDQKIKSSNNSLQYAQNSFKSRRPTFASFLQRPRIIAGIFANFSTILPAVYYTPYLSKYLKLRYNIQQQNDGLYYGIRAFGSALGALASPWLSRKIGRSNSIWLFLMIIIISNLISTQSWAFAIPKYVQFIVIGYFLMGLSTCQISVQIVPQMCEYIIEYQKQKLRKKNNLPDNKEIHLPEQYEQVSVQIASSLFTFSYGVSQVIGPMMGAFLYELIGYSKAGDAQTLLIFILFIIYSIYGGVTWLSCCKKQNSK